MRFPGTRLNVVCHYPHEGEVLARGEGWIEDVVCGIIDNSVKHAGKSEVSISIDVMPAKTGMDESVWKVEIADDGPGIPDVLKSSLTVDSFGAGNRFTRGVASALTFMSLIMEEMGGQLKVENRIPGDYSKGTKVSLLVPRTTELPSPPRPTETH
jgi:K+-sensing histidine kinase KdpD